MSKPKKEEAPESLRAAGVECGKDKSGRMISAPAETQEPISEPERTVFEEPTYRGFLIVKCESCGAVRAFCSRTGIKSNRCSVCGHETVLKDMTAAELRCPTCKEDWKYKTNCTDAEVTVRCLNCKTELTGRWDKKRRSYRTI